MRRKTQQTLQAQLADGTEVLLRPIGPDDKPLLEAGMTRLSENSRRLRFMTPIESLSRSQLSYLTEIDHRNHLAWGALVEGDPVAVARVVRLTHDPAEAELAITVVDDYQRRGLGRLLLELMAELCRHIGIQRFVFEALPENEGIVRLLKNYGADHDMGTGVITGTLDLAGVPLPSLSTGEALALADSARRQAV
ncbi:MAG TPA: GNAT family N-acetyltransferase [Acidimicrobiia bacterium]|nr:GNAT family N-acetyltransferase [Acidimicrobiia bacterium]